MCRARSNTLQTENSMERIRKNLKKFSQKLPKVTMVYIAFVIFMGIVLMSMLRSYSAIQTKRAELEQVQAQCELQQMENDALSELLENSDAEYIERKAREELDYVLPGERVYIIRPGN